MAIKFGWCITGHHDDCTKTLAYYEKTHNCECVCHSKPDTNTPATLGTNKTQRK